MSYRGIVEMALHLSSFKNVDLLQQGIYQLRFSVYHLSADSSKKFMALPYGLMYNKEAPKKVTQKIDFYRLAPAKILDSEHVFCTPVFVVRYCQEEIPLNLIVQFRTELDLLPSYEKTKFFLETELLWADYAATGSAEKAVEYYIHNGGVPLKVVERRLHKLCGVARGAFAGYVPLTFSGPHSSLMALSFHSVILDYKLRNSLLEEQNSMAADEPVVAIKPVLGKTPTYPAKILGLKYRPKELAHYFFCNAKGKLPIQIEKCEIDDVYNYYVVFLERVLHDFKAKCGQTTKLEDLSNIELDTTTPLNPKDITKYVNKRPKSLSVNKENIPFFGSKRRPEPVKPSPLKEEDVCDAEETMGTAVNVPQMRTNEKLFRCKNETQFSARVRSNNPYTVTRELLKEINNVAGKILQAWNKYLEALCSKSTTIIEQLKKEYDKAVKETFEYFVFTKCLDIDHESYVKTLRSKGYCNVIPTVPIQDQTIFGQVDNIPLVFENRSAVAEKRQSETTGSHLFIFVHGFQGCASDMKTLKNQLSLYVPKAHFLCARANERDTDGDIDAMGKKLAEEIKKYVRKSFLTPAALGKITFLAHSLGGLITRAALPLLGEYKEKMWNLITFSSPHLGYMFSESKLVNAGLWILKKWYGSKCLEQLSFSEKERLDECYLYRLAMASGVEWFKNILLVGSHQDMYSPYESSRMELCKNQSGNSLQHKTYKKMVEVMQSKMKDANVYRLDVGFNISKSNMSTFVGRTAHILFLQSEVLMKMLLSRYEFLLN